MKLFLRFLPPLLLVLCVFSLPQEALAQTITLNERTGFEIVRADERPSNERPLWISREDCFDASPDRYHVDTGTGTYTWLHFQPAVSGYRDTDSIEVWVSQTADCTDTNILEGNAGSCTLVGGVSKAKRNPELYINPRDVIEEDSSLAEWSSEPESPAGKENTCNKQLDQTLTFYILLRRGNDIIESAKWEQSGVDTQAPSPPESMDAAAGDEHIFFEWEIDTDAESEDTYGFAFFCVPTGTSSEDGAGGAGGAGGGGGNDDCPQEILSAGRLPDEEMLEFLCGSQLGRGAREGQAEGVENMTTYAVAIAATDTVRNKGKLSAISCVTPKEVTTFYERYKESGGKGGGGFCAWGRKPGGGLLALLGATCLIYFLRRRSARGRDIRGFY